MINWSGDQKKVIETRNRNLLVSAAAGSGKTAVLVERIISMITDKNTPVDIDRLLVVTFTNAAASEMRERIGDAIQRLLDEQPENEHLQRQSTLVHHAQITTIHSFCLNLIRNHFNELELDPSFRIADEGELMLLQADVMKQMLEDFYEQGLKEFEDFVDIYATGKADGGIDTYIYQVYHFAMSNPMPDEWIKNCRRELETDDMESVEDTKWMRYLEWDVRLQLKELLQQAGEALEICESEEGLSAYLPMFTNDLQRIKNLEKFESFKELNDGLCSFKFDTLGRVKKDAVAAEIKDFVTSSRDLLKKSIKKLQSLYCFENTEDILNDIKGSSAPVNTLLMLAEEFGKRYKDKKREKNIVDFNDLEHEALRVLIKNEDGKAVFTATADQLSSQYEEILIDEYQDSNYVQEMLMNSISRERFGSPNIFMVGDVKQSIYRFRLARPELFMEKYDSYTKEDSRRQKIELHQNFRSRESVLKSINCVFEKIMSKNLGNIEYTEETALHPGAVFKETDRNAGSPTELIMIDTGHEALKQLDEENADYTSRELEAKVIAGKIRLLTDSEKGFYIWDKEKQEYRLCEYGDIVIILRSISGFAETFVQVLTNEGIPAFAETKTGYFNTVEVETVLSMLAVIDNPMQDIPLAAVLKSPIGNISDEELAIIAASYKKSAKIKKKGFYEAVLNYLNQEIKRDEILFKKLSKAMEMIGYLSEKAEFLSVHELLYEVFSVTGYYDYVSAMPLGQTRKANLDMLVEKSLSYETTSYHGVFHFIRYIERLKKYKTDFGEASVSAENQNRVRIMSIHKSKGLEFPVVFLAGMGKMFNKQDAYSKILIDPELGIGADYLDLEKRLKTVTLKKNVLKRRLELESTGEELRVLYVAMTRAKEKLIMTGTDRGLAKKLDKWMNSEDKPGKLPFTITSSASSYLDWILMSMPHCKNVIMAEEAELTDIISGEVQKQAVKEFSKEELLEFDGEQIYDIEYRNKLKSIFSYVYPYEEEKQLHIKMSVSELKKTGQFIDDEESEFLPTLPVFLRTGELVHDEDVKKVNASLRGTAYHRVLELLEFDKINSLEDTYTEIDNLKTIGKIPEHQLELIDISAVWKFMESGLGRRMASAQLQKRLFKEKQFVIGIPAKEMGEWTSDELILIQGIIDAYFEDEGGIVLVDYKTDRVSAGGEEILIRRYAPQMKYYQKAIEQITGKHVTEKIIYSLSLQKEIRLD